MAVAENVSEAIKIDVWSDIACPWCYIGKRKFERGAETFRAEHPDAPEIQVEYHSYELSPETPVEFDGSISSFLADFKGIPESEAERMHEQVTAVAAQVDLPYDFASLQHTNTVRAHQILHLAKAEGLQLEMAERLFSAYFVEGRHVGRIEDLADLGAEIGLDRDAIVRSLGSDEYLPAVRQDQEQARRYGINGVPFFVIDGKYGVSGAQDPTTFAAALSQVVQEREPADATAAS